ncbi:hypothetical protein [Dyadobacter sp. CY312]|uniref:hypothetical protein n=1 Tax=Dyadobacter sp. CY312 TaxID=2907303 RepID=UPI001F39D1DE|nr:hypothetical protein [Dyadobacter sp. CY312]MCE7040098.1 hypothetical protein [Dyadobacter sp. CY312]
MYISIKFYLAVILFAMFSHCSLAKHNFPFEKNNSNYQIHNDSVRVPKAYELFTIADSLIKMHGYKKAVEFLTNYEKYYSDPMEKGMFNQVMMTYQSYKGDTKAALKYESQLSPNKQTEDYSFPENFMATPASTVIMNLSANKQVVMFNEAHHRPQHRAFIRSLLKDFYSLGFRTLLVEAYFENEDSLLNDRGYPLQKTGSYTKEPAFGQMLREAKNLGFTIASYDNDTTTCNSTEPFVCNNQREKVAAENIFNFIKTNPNAKILVAAGYAHIIKKSDDGWIKMAEQFKNISGINPLSIDLVGMAERSSAEYENKFYKAAMEKYNIIVPSVILNNETKEVFLRNYSQEQIDLQIVFPRTKYTNGYSDWLSEGYKKEIKVNLTKTSCKVGDLLQVYIKNEVEKYSNQAVPFLQYPLNDIKQQKLLLPENYTYSIVVDHGVTKSTVKVTK